MTSPNDTIQEAIRVVAASVGNEEENITAATTALDAAKALGNGDGDDWHGWHALAMGLVNLSQILPDDRQKATGEAPLDVLRSCAARYPRP